MTLPKWPKDLPEVSGCRQSRFKKAHAWLKKETVFASLVDRETNVTVHEFKFGKNYHWVLINVICLVGILQKWL